MTKTSNSVKRQQRISRLEYISRVVLDNERGNDDGDDAEFVRNWLAHGAGAESLAGMQTGIKEVKQKKVVRYEFTGNFSDFLHATIER